MRLMIFYILSLILIKSYLYADGVTVTVDKLNEQFMESNQVETLNVRLSGNVAGGVKYAFQLDISGSAVDTNNVIIFGKNLYIFDFTDDFVDKYIDITFKLHIMGDNILNSNRDLKINIYTPTSSTVNYQFAGILNAIQTITIIDDDVIEVTTVNQTFLEKDIDSKKNIIFNIKDNKKVPSDVNIKYEILNSSKATFNIDYSGLEKNGIIILKAYETTLALPEITIKADNIPDNGEYIEIRLSDPSNRIIFSNKIVKININDWQKPTVGFYSSRGEMIEGEKKSFWIALNNKIDSESSVDIQINHGDSITGSTIQATNNSDISPNPYSGIITLIISAGHMYQQLTMEAIENTLQEPVEIFHLKIVDTSDNIEINVNKNIINIPISDNDFKTKAKIITSFKPIIEGEPACITVEVDKTKNYNYNIQYQINFNETDLTLRANKYDLTRGTSLLGNIMINKNSRYGNICFATEDDNIIEKDELFEISISVEIDNPDVEIPTNFKHKIKFQIINNDSLKNGGKTLVRSSGITAPIIINSTNYPITYTESDINKIVQFYFYLNKPIPVNGYSLEYTLINDFAISGQDFTAKSGILNFNINDRNKSIDIEILGDNNAEFLENFILSIHSDTLSIENKIINLSILDDEIGVFISQKSFTINEGDCNFDIDCHLNPTRVVSLPVIKLNNIPTTMIQVDYELLEGTAHTNIDFKPLKGTLKFTPHSPKEFTLNMEIFTNLLEGSDREFTLKLSNPKNLEILEDELTIIIKDDDIYPTISINNQYFTETDNNQTQYLYIKLINGTSKLDFDIAYSFMDGTAKNGTDYSGIDGVFKIKRGREYSYANFIIKGDLTEEKPKRESFFLKLSDATYAHFEKNSDGTKRDTITVEIRDNDIIPSITDTEKTIDETDYNRTEILKINMDNISKNDDFIIYYKIEANSSLENIDYIKDYNGSFGTTLVKKGNSSFDIPIKIIGDRIDEVTKSFNLIIYDLDLNKLNILNDENATSITIPIYINDESDPLPFTCNKNLYLSSTFNYEISKNILNKMYLYNIDIKNKKFGFDKLEPKDGSNYTYNALGFNPKDNYLYALYLNYIYRIGTDKVKKVGQIKGLASKQYYAGVFDKKGVMYIGGLNIATDKIYSLDVITGKIIKTITLSKTLNMFDFGIRNDTELYFVPRRSFLHKVNLTNGQVSILKGNYTAAQVQKYNFDAFYSDVEGKMYANDSNGNGFYQILTNGNFIFISNSERSTNNDGANCPIEVINIFKDRSDAPKSYGEVYHIIDGELKIGKLIDHEYNSTVSPNGTGDDLSGKDDEDGVIENIVLKFPIDKFELDVEVTNLKDEKAYLIGWIDFNKNGRFESNEKSITSIVNKNSSSLNVKLRWDLKYQSLIEVDTFVRLRLSTDLSSLNVNTDMSINGEVEDHKIKILNQLFYNIERTDSKSSSTIKSKQSLYTQITNQEFTYSLVFYDSDFITEKKININTVAKIEIINIDQDYIPVDIPDNNIKLRIGDNILGVDYIYISKDNSRFNSRIKSLFATKNAKFRITFLKDSFNRIADINCDEYGMDLKGCYDKEASTQTVPNIIIEDSKDTFAIRPEFFIVDFNDTLTIVDTNIVSIAEKNYIFDVKAVKKSLNAIELIESFNSYQAKILLKFIGNSTCPDKNNQLDRTIIFKNGQVQNETLTSFNTGIYQLSIIDEKWTEIDQTLDNLGCILNSASNTMVNGKYGCNVSINKDIIFNFQPSKLNINLINIKNNLHSSSGSLIDAVYMDNIKNLKSSGFLIEGKIDTLGEKGGVLTNFTRGCMASDIKLKLDVDMNLSSGLISPKTIYGSSLESKLLIFSDGNFTSGISNLNNNFLIPKYSFLDINKGETNFKILINIQKKILEEANPIVIKFKDLSAEYNTSISTSHIPEDIVNLNKRVVFLYATIIPDKKKYEPLYFNDKSSGTEKVILTPLTSVAFCDDISFCSEETDLNITQHMASGGNWYRLFNFINSSNHIELKKYSNLLSFSNSKYPTFRQGRAEFYTKYIGISGITESIKLNYSPWLSYSNNQFDISFEPKKDDKFKGLGEVGSILKDTNLNTTPNKMN